ncbi:MAG: tRNA (guanosine(46)-N7)-methyltransferase TrmB [Gammaproteobacteria bacterium]
MASPPSIRPIRSYVRREGRLTPAQRRALASFWPSYGADPVPGLLDFIALFGRDAPCVLEIGFGDGEALAAMAQAHPDWNYLGIEVHRPGIGHLLMRLQTLALDNVRVMCGDAADIMRTHLADASLERVQIFFPDPWQKSRHHKRRLIQPEFVALLARKIRSGGLLHLATDWRDYAEHMLAVLATAGDFTNTSAGFIPRPVDRPLTKFEQRGLRLGHEVWELQFRRR